MALTAEQERQVERQLLAHHHSRYEVDLALAADFTVASFVVEPHVMRPEVMSSRWLAEFLATRPDLYSGKRVLDLGCGSGIQGIVMALRSARAVVFSDVAFDAISNTRENIARYGLGNRTEIMCGDLLDAFSGMFDVIVFNHPFFPGRPHSTEPIEIAMLDEGELIHRFFEAARERTRAVVMPYFHIAGATNDPGVQCQKHGFAVAEHQMIQANEGLQMGQFSFYVLTPPISASGSPSGRPAR